VTRQPERNRWTIHGATLAAVGVLLLSSCGGSPAAPTDADTATHLMHLQPACASLTSNVPEALWDVQLILAGENAHLIGGSVSTGGRNSPALSIDLQVTGSAASGTIGGRYWIGIPNLLLEISQPGSTGYAATVSGAVDSTGKIVGTLDGRLSVFDGRTDPDATWVSCDSTTHRFEISRLHQ